MQYSNSQKTHILYEIESKLIPSESLSEITNKFKNELEARLNNSDNSMLPSFLKKSKFDNNNNNKNNNDILAIDFGGTNLKFAIFKTYPTYSIQYMNSMTIENKLVNLEFFDNIVETIILQLNDYFITHENLLTKRNREQNHVPISITFSFPLNNKNEITVMGKNFQLTNEIKGKPINKILQSSFNKFSNKYLNSKIKFHVNENIINDSIAVHLTNKYMAHDEKIEDNKISLILGTGLNTCFEVPFNRLPNFKKQADYTSNRNIDEGIIINSELGFLGAGVIKLCDDFDVVSNLSMPMPLENITSGNYLPEILKRILRFYNVYPELTINFDGEMFCQLVEGEDIKSMISDIDVEFIRDIANIILQRASIYIVAALNAINEFIHSGNVSNNNNSDHHNTINIGYVGSFLAYGKTYQEMIDKYSQGQINLQFLPDSSLIGAAVIGEKY